MVFKKDVLLSRTNIKKTLLVGGKWHNNFKAPCDWCYFRVIGGKLGHLLKWVAAKQPKMGRF